MKIPPPAAKALRLFPSWVLGWYADRLFDRFKAADDEVKRVAGLLEDVSPGYEYTEGFRDHLARRLEDVEDRRARLAESLNVLDAIVYPLPKD